MGAGCVGGGEICMSMGIMKSQRKFEFLDVCKIDCTARQC